MTHFNSFVFLDSPVSYRTFFAPISRDIIDFLVLAFTEKNGFVTATKLGTTNKFFVAAAKNFAAATKRFVGRTKHFVVTKYFCYFNK